MPVQQFHFPALFSLPLLLGFFVWQLQVDTFSEGAGPASSANLPQAIVERPQIQIFSREGLLQQSFSGVSLASSARGNELEIQLPQFELADGNGDFWSLNAVRGFYDQNSERLRLDGAVQMVRTTGNLPVQMYTEEIQLDINGRWVRSDSPVRIESIGHYLRGTGLMADLQNGTFELLSEVEALHEIH